MLDASQICLCVVPTQLLQVVVLIKPAGCVQVRVYMLQEACRHVLLQRQSFI